VEATTIVGGKSNSTCSRLLTSKQVAAMVANRSGVEDVVRRKRESRAEEKVKFRKGLRSAVRHSFAGVICGRQAAFKRPNRTGPLLAIRQSGLSLLGLRYAKR
jgi:hypothetical protein